MSKSNRSGQPTRGRRVNPRALVVVGLVLLAAPPALLGLRALQERRGASALLAEARRAADADRDRDALGYLDRYLGLRPEDLGALDLKARLLARGARSAAQIDEALEVHTKVLGLVEKRHLKPADWIETRRRLVRLGVEQAESDQAPAIRDQARVLVAELAAAGRDDAEAHRLLAQTLEHVASFTVNDAEKLRLLDEARGQYETAEAMDPGDVKGAELLSGLYLGRLRKVDRAAEVIARVVASTGPEAAKAAGRVYDPKAHAAALVLRARFTLQQATPARGADPLPPARRAELVARVRDDLDEAVRTDPASVEARIAAAEAALVSPGPSTANARRYLVDVPADHRDDRGVRLVEARIDLTDRQVDSAIGSYRAALARSGGNDPLLTWELAMLLIDLGRVDDRTADLVDQYERLGGATVLPFRKADPARHQEEQRRFDNRCRFLRGRLALRRNRPAEALAYLEPLRTKALGEPVPARGRPSEEVLGQAYFVELGNAYFATRDVEKAREAFVKATEQPALSSAPWLALSRLDKTGRPDAALASLRAGLTVLPDDLALLAEVGDVLMRRELAKADPAQRSWADVEEVLRRAEAVNPTAPDVVLNRARYLVVQGRPEDAVQWIAAASRKQPRSVELWTAQINHELSVGRLQRADALLEQAEAAAGPQADFTQLRALLMVRRGEVTRACELLTGAVERVPSEQRGRLWRMLGELHQSRGEAAAAKAAYEAWARVEPEDPEPCLALVNLALARGDDPAIDEAIERVRRVVGEGGYQWRAARVQSLLRDRGGKPPTEDRLAEAQELVGELKARDARLPVAPILEGMLADRRGRTDEAIAAFTRGVELGGGTDALARLVNVLVRADRKAELEALRKKPGVSAAEVDRLVLAQSTVNRGGARADQLAALATRGQPQGFDLRAWQTHVFGPMGDPKEVQGRLEARTREKPTELSAWLPLFLFQAAQGRQADAAATLETMRGKVQPSAGLEPVWAQCLRLLGQPEKGAALFEAALKARPADAALLRAAVGFLGQTGAPALRERAVELLQSAHERDPSAGWVRRQLAEVLAARPSDRASWTRAVEVIGADPRPDDTAEDKLTRARVYSLSPGIDDREKAVGVLSALAAELPGSAVVQEALARLLVLMGRDEAARPHAARAAAGDQAPLEAVHLHAGLLLTLKDADEAARQIDRIRRVDPDGLPLVELQARLLALQGKPAEAASALEKAYTARAGAPDALAVGEAVVSLVEGFGQPEAAERLARALAEKGPRGKLVLARQLVLNQHPPEALALLDEVGAADPAAAGAVALGLATRPGADPRFLAAADRLLDQALKAVPTSDDPPARQLRAGLTEQLALVRHFQKRFQDEVDLYRAMLERKPADRLFLNNYAWTLSEELRQPGPALALVDEALAAVGPYPAVLDTRGVILGRLGRGDEAVKMLDAAIRGMARPSASYLFHLARVHLGMKRADEARAYRDRARAAGLTRDQLQPSEQADWDAVMTP